MSSLKDIALLFNSKHNKYFTNHFFFLFPGKNIFIPQIYLALLKAGLRLSKLKGDEFDGDALPNAVAHFFFLILEAKQ